MIEALRRQLGVALSVLKVFVPKIMLQRARTLLLDIPDSPRDGAHHRDQFILIHY
jgi:hypothetical protein